MPGRRFCCCHALAAISSLSAYAAAAADDWPHFRGPNHDGLSTETNLRTEWDTPIPLVWEREIGDAFSSFAIVAGRLYTCGTQDKQQTLFCLDAADGSVIWQRPFERAYHESHGSGTRATPTVDDGRVYILGGHGRLVCFDAESGEELWFRTFHNPPTWGYSGSVLIDSERAIVGVGGREGALVALDKVSGQTVWSAGSGPAGYATPYPFTFEAERYIVGFLGDKVIIVEARDGRVVWEMGWKTSYKVNAAAPIFDDGRLFLTSGYYQGCVLLDLARDGERLTAAPVWQSDILLNKFQSCVLLDGHLYTSDQKALKCVVFLTGEQKWIQQRIKHGTIVGADGNLFLLSEKGELMIGKASPDGFEPTTRASILSGRCWTVPVLWNGRIYARSLQRVVCFDLRGEE